MITTITLNPAIDKTITIDRLEYGSVNRVEKGVLDTGGKGLNVSKVLGKLNDKTTAIGLLGKYNKDKALELIKKELFETEFVYVDDVTRTNTIIVDLERGITTNINEEGFFVNEANYDLMKNLIAEYSSKSKFMIFGGSAPKGIKQNVYKECIELVREKCLTVLDADGELLIEGLKASPYMIKPNIHELENAFNTVIKNDQEIIDLSRKIIKDYKVKLVLISMGGDGCILITEDEAYKALPVPVEVKSTVGAGDSLVAGFVHGLNNNLSYEECLAYGTVCGAIAVMREGVGNFEKEELNDFLKKVVVQKIE